MTVASIWASQHVCPSAPAKIGDFGKIVGECRHQNTILVECIEPEKSERKSAGMIIETQWIWKNKTCSLNHQPAWFSNLERRKKELGGSIFSEKADVFESLPFDSLDGALLLNQRWTFVESYMGRFRGHFTVSPLVLSRFAGLPDVSCLISLHRSLGNKTPLFPHYLAKNLLVAPTSVEKNMGRFPK